MNKVYTLIELETQSNFHNKQKSDSCNAANKPKKSSKKTTTKKQTFFVFNH